MLKPALARLWRDPVTLQLGVGPAHAVLLRGADLSDLSLLDLLDGSRTVAATVAEAARHGHDRTAVDEALATLTQAGALDDAAGGPPAAELEPDLLSLSLVHSAPGAGRAVLAARARRGVAVRGGSRVGATAAGLLAASGVGTVAVTDERPIRDGDLAPGGLRPADRTGGSRGTVATRLARSVATAHADIPAAPELVILAPTGPVIPPEWLAETRDVEHLPVVVRETTALIGPLVVPGRTPCLRCVELARSDRDPAWPSLTAQLLGMSRRAEPCDVTLATFAAALTVMQALTRLDGAPAASPATGAVLEFGLSDLRLRRRAVTAHPGCGCGAADG